jgi:hypothetical protein
MRFLLFLLVSVPLVACSATRAASSTGISGGGDGGAGGGSGGDSSAGGAGEGGIGDLGGQGGGVPVGETEVFGHSAVTLYRLDPVTKQVTVVGDFDGCFGEGVIDIALDRYGSMIGTVVGGLYHIDKSTAKCALIKSGDYPNSLSFVPKGTVDPEVEALVGFEGSDYVRIFPDTGVKQKIGTLDGGYVSSGDVVSVIGGGTYLTVFGGPEGCGDCLLEVDPTTGAVVKNLGPLPYGTVYGLAFWGGSVYGFDAGGALFQIDLASVTTTEIPIPGATADLSFYGAGSTTSAPLEPPQ